MPKPHYPSHGRPGPRGWMPPQGEARLYEDAQAAEPRSPQELKSEIERLRRELHEVNQQERQSQNLAPEAMTSVRMVWLALAFCGAGLVFALYALYRHG